METNEDKLNQSIERIDELYKESKECLSKISALQTEYNYFHRLFGVIAELKDIATNCTHEIHDIKKSLTHK